MKHYIAKTYDTAGCNYDANHRNIGRLQEEHKIVRIIFLLCYIHKRNTEIKSAT